MSDSLRPHGQQHARLPCLSVSPRICSIPYPLSQWCHPTTSSSVTLFALCLQSFPASGSFPMSQLFVSGGQSIGASVSASVLPMNEYSELIFFRVDWFGLIAIQWILKSLLQPHNSKASIIQHSAFFMAQLLHQSMTTGKHSFNYSGFCWKNNVSAF